MNRFRTFHKKRFFCVFPGSVKNDWLGPVGGSAPLLGLLQRLVHGACSSRLWKDLGLTTARAAGTGQGGQVPGTAGLGWGLSLSVAPLPPALMQAGSRVPGEASSFSDCAVPGIERWRNVCDMFTGVTAPQEGREKHPWSKRLFSAVLPAAQGDWASAVPCCAVGHRAPDWVCSRGVSLVRAGGAPTRAGRLWGGAGGQEGGFQRLHVPWDTSLN